MAVIYLAYDRQLDRQVAIKVLHSTLSKDKNSAARLAHEARMVAQLEHPNIVSIYNLERLRDGSVALVMQYVRGRTLRNIIDEEGQLPITFVEKVLTQIASALGVAHRNGIVHRDVKPENIYLEDDTGRPLLADFGIAHAPKLQTGLTLAGEALGTPHYMSPEQIAGGALDGRSDLYSLGLVGYEMLTGDRPWGRESFYNVMYKQQHQNLPSLSDRRNLPVALQQALEQLLRKNPSDRPSTAEAFLAMLPAHEELTFHSASRREERQGSQVPPVWTGPDQQTVRYRRSEVKPSETAAPAKADDREPESARRALGAGEPTGQVAHARASAESLGANPTAPAAPTDELAAKMAAAAAARPAKSAKPVKRGKLASREVVVVGAAALFTGLLVVLFGLLRATGTLPTSGRQAAEREAQNTRPSNSQSSDAPASVAPAPAGRSGGGRSAANDFTYAATGDLSDIFCRPRDGETLEAWMQRVPTYCRDRIQR
jgi:serine/threonine-protein kinase